MTTHIGRLLRDRKNHPAFEQLFNLALVVSIQHDGHHFTARDNALAKLPKLLNDIRGISPPRPVADRDLLLKALQHVNDTSGLLNDIAAAVSKLHCAALERDGLVDQGEHPDFAALDTLLVKRITHGGVGLFLEADALGIDTSTISDDAQPGAGA